MIHASRISRLSVILLYLLVGGCNSAPEGTLQKKLISRTKQASVSMVNNVDKTFDQINRGKAPYQAPNNVLSYVYVYDLDLEIVAHPFPNKIGLDHSDHKDARGMAYPKIIKSRATNRKRGQEGWIEYIQNDMNIIAYFELAQGKNGLYYIVVSTHPISSNSSQSGNRKIETAPKRMNRVQKNSE